MTVERGHGWGERTAAPADLVVVRNDAEAGALAQRRRSAGEPIPPIGVLDGDLRRTLGGLPVASLDGEVGRFVVDLGVAELDGRRCWFVSHLVARRRWWTGDVLAVMNAEFLGRWDVAPRSHPNDGRLDVLRVSRMRLGQRWQAWRRLPTGTHVPHPSIATERVTTLDVTFAQPAPVRLDGVMAGSVSHLVVRVEPDALTICL
jgi:hypothetical protein